MPAAWVISLGMFVACAFITVQLLDLLTSGYPINGMVRSNQIDHVGRARSINLIVCSRLMLSGSDKAFEVPCLRPEYERLLREIVPGTHLALLRHVHEKP